MHDENDEYQAVQQFSNRLRDAYQQIDFVDPATGATGASSGNHASAATSAQTALIERIERIDARMSIELDRLTRWGIADTTTNAQIALNDTAVYDVAVSEPQRFLSDSSAFQLTVGD